ncbi:MAG: C69 family dipeptidase [Deltaproteobacteria bacterium]|nr:C69 family dipeptidase [Deltaproteobacteria bacterium]
MCDTFVVTSEATSDGAVLFGKNSDRELDEPQVVECHAAADHPPGAEVGCTYLPVAQVPRTHGVMLSRPSWMWGAEMGANDQGLVMGNEAVFTRAPQQETGLLGMDLLRLTLERAGSACQGVTILTDLLAEHGQGGACGYRNQRFRYDNSFLLADPEDAWVVETAGRAWVAARVCGVRAISNGLTLGERYDRASDHLAAEARDLGLLRGKGPVHFTRCFGRASLTWAAAAGPRRGCVEHALRGRVELAGALGALRQHGGARRPGGGLRQTVCAHASWLPTRQLGQTTSSWLSHLTAERHTHFVTGTSAPCTSVFKPTWLDTGLPGYGPAPGLRYDEASLWWRHERLHDLALSDLPGFLRRHGPERDSLEAAFIAAAMAARGSLARRTVTESAFAQGGALEQDWTERLERRPVSNSPTLGALWRKSRTVRAQLP